MITYSAVVLAAGQGKRMNAGKNKQFLMIGKDPLIIHTLKPFMNDSSCKEIILVIQKNEQEQFKHLLQSYQLLSKVKLIDGGKERQDSVYQGLKAVTHDFVMIHDGARPFITVKELQQLLNRTELTHAAIFAVPVTDTIKKVSGKKLETLDRSVLWAAQTPQAFSLPLIKKAHQHALDNHFLGTDDASLVEEIGHAVEIVEGSYHNMKLTTPEDLKRAEAIWVETTKNEVKE